MTKTILDTSSLIELALAERDTETPKGYSRAFRYAHGGIDEAIEALVLYDELAFDGPSLMRNAERLPQLTEYYKFGSPLWADDVNLESRVYRSILENYTPQIQDTGPSLWDLFRMHTEEWMAADVGVRNYYPSAHWRDIESELTGEAAKVARSLRERLGDRAPNWGAACALLLRTLYYDRLQQLASANLILHPLKGTLLGGIRDPEASQRSADSDIGVGKNILSMFDDKVRKAFYERKERWLGRRDLTYEVPMLTSFVLNKCRSWQDLSRVIEEVRESKEAHEFRGAVHALLDASANRRNEEVDEVLSQLSAAAQEWTVDLRKKRAKKTITVSIPLVNVGTEIDVPDRKFKKTSADRMLVFIHWLLSSS